MKEVDTFLTISGESTGLYKEKGSKFLAFAYSITNDKDVKNCLGELRKKYYDARHHCYAYVMQPDQSKYRANDDGEPGHSAGDPILGQIRSRKLTNTLVVVVRYFGGTKLGVSGLINAYKTAASQALDNSLITKIAIIRRVVISYPYELTHSIMKEINSTGITVVGQKFDQDCEIIIDVELKILEKLKSGLELMKKKGQNLTFQINQE